MIAKFLYSSPPNLKSGGDAFAPKGLPVVPWYMPAPPNMFVAAGTLKLVPCAEVLEQDISLDALASTLFSDYPGIPMQVHENYVMATALACAGLAPGTLVRPIVTAHEASIQVLNETTTVQLWTTPPTKGKLK